MAADIHVDATVGAEGVPIVPKSASAAKRPTGARRYTKLAILAIKNLRASTKTIGSCTACHCRPSAVARNVRVGAVVVAVWVPCVPRSARLTPCSGVPRRTRANTVGGRGPRDDAHSIVATAAGGIHASVDAGGVRVIKSVGTPVAGVPVETVRTATLAVWSDARYNFCMIIAADSIVCACLVAGWVARKSRAARVAVHSRVLKVTRTGTVSLITGYYAEPTTAGGRVRACVDALLGWRDEDPARKAPFAVRSRVTKGATLAVLPTKIFIAVTDALCGALHFVGCNVPAAVIIDVARYSRGGWHQSYHQEHCPSTEKQRLHFEPPRLLRSNFHLLKKKSIL